jgi:hypothetical protein
MSVRLVDSTPEAAVLRGAAHAAAEDLFTLSIQDGGLVGLLELIAGNKDRLTEQEGMAIGALAEMAQQIENEINAIADRLGKAMDGDEASAS